MIYKVHKYSEYAHIRYERYIWYTNFPNMQSIGISSKLKYVSIINKTERMSSERKKSFQLLENYE